MNPVVFVESIEKLRKPHHQAVVSVTRFDPFKMAVVTKKGEGGGGGGGGKPSPVRSPNVKRKINRNRYNGEPENGTSEKLFAVFDNIREHNFDVGRVFIFEIFLRIRFSQQKIQNLEEKKNK